MSCEDLGVFFGVPGFGYVKFNGAVGCTGWWSVFVLKSMYIKKLHRFFGE